MKLHWIKFSDERNIYLVNLADVSTFALTQNRCLIFCLPGSKGIKIVLHPQNYADFYQQVLDYIIDTTGQSF